MKYNVKLAYTKVNNTNMNIILYRKTKRMYSITYNTFIYNNCSFISILNKIILVKLVGNIFWIFNNIIIEMKNHKMFLY